MTDLPDKAHLRVDEVAIYFGVSERLIRLLIQRRELPVVRIGAAIRIPAKAVKALETINCTATVV